MAEELIEQTGPQPVAPMPQRAAPIGSQDAQTQAVEPVRAVLVCQCSEGRVAGWPVREGAHEYATLSSAQQATELLRKLGRRVLVAAILPKSSYLTRLVQLPKVSDQERLAMLQLELEAQLPAEFEDIEVGYRPLGQSKEGYERLEAFVARRSAIEGMLEQLAAVGIEPHYILPSAAIWAELLGRSSQWHAMAGGTAYGELEIASLERGGQTLVRTIGQVDHPASVNRQLAEYLRTALAASGADGDRPLVIGWAGGSPPLASNCRVKIHAIRTPFTVPADVGDPGAAPGALLAMAADVLSRYGLTQPLRTANLLPAALRQKRSRRMMLRRALFAVGLLALAVVFGLSALKVAIWRYEASERQLSERIAAIRGEGEAIGRQIGQLEAVGLARATANDLTGVLNDLYDATPSGISYNQVELGEDGTLRLRGQGESLSDVFLLPQKLEQTPMFHSVRLQDAGQTNKGEGSVVEFRIDAKLRRQTPSKQAPQP